MTSLRLPNITALDTEGQVNQIRSYLFQLYEHLSVTERSLSSSTGGGVTYMQSATSGSSKREELDGDYEKLKQLIITSADIVNAYYDKISRRLRSQYVAQSDFGIYKEYIETDYLAKADGLEARFNELQEIIGTNEDGTVYQLSAYIRAGRIEDGIYGIEVGQTSDETFTRFARFTASGLYFYDGTNEAPTAWIENGVLYIISAEIRGNLILGGYKYDTSDGIIHQWIGG